MATLKDDFKLVKLRLETEKLIRSNSVENFINFVRNNGILETEEGEEEFIFSNGKILKGQAYQLTGECFPNEFFITKENRCFWLHTLLEKIEVLDN